LPTDRENHDRDFFVGQSVLEIEEEFDDIKSRKVGATRRLDLFWVKRERVTVDERVWNVGVELPRLDQTEIASLAPTEPGLVIETQMDILDGILAPLARVIEVVVAEFLALATDCPDEFDDWVVEIELHTDLATLEGGLEDLVLLNELLKGSRGEPVSFLNVQVNVHRLETCLEIVGIQGLAVAALDHENVAVRDLYTPTQFLETHKDLDPVKLQGNQSQCITGRVRKPPRQRYVQTSVLLRIGHQLSPSKPLAYHLGQPFARLAREFFPHEQKIIVQIVVHLTTNHQTRLLDQKLPNGVHIVTPGPFETRTQVHIVHGSEFLVLFLRATDNCPGTHTLRRRTVATRVTWVATRELVAANAANRHLRLTARYAWQVDDHVLEVNQVPVAVQSHLTVPTKRNLGVESLLN
jgi:hypothetical protein